MQHFIRRLSTCWCRDHGQDVGSTELNWGCQLNSTVLFLYVLLGLAGCSSAAEAQIDPGGPISYTICSTSLNSQWQNWSWNTVYHYDQITPDGDKALMVQYKAAGAGLYLHATNPISLVGLTDLKIWVQGGDKPQQIQVIANNSTPISTFTTTPKQWSLVSIPLTALGNLTHLTDLYFQNPTTGEQSTWYAKIIYLQGSEGVKLPETDVIVTPNPVEAGQNQVLLQFIGFTVNEPVQLTLIDMYGRIIRQRAVILSTVNEQLSVDGLAAGHYFVSVEGLSRRHIRKILIR